MFILKITFWNPLLLSDHNAGPQSFVQTATNSWQVKLYQTFRAAFLTTLVLFTTQLFAQVQSTNEDIHQQMKPSKDQATAVQPSPQNQWSFIHPYSARYIVSSDGDKIGYSNRELKKQENIWQLSTDAEVSKYFLKMTSQEFSRFTLIDNKLTTLEFGSKTKISFKKERHMNQIFDWDTGTELGNRDNKKWRLEHSELAYDRVSHLIQMRADLLAQREDFTYAVSYKGKLDLYSYQHQGTEVITTKMGKLKTIKFSRKKANGDIFIVWLSPELNYFPAKIAQLEDDKPEITMTLEHLDYQSTTLVSK